MLRAAVLLALVAFVVAQNSPFVDVNINSPQFTSSGSQVRFIPRGGRVLAVPSTNTGGFAISGTTAGAYRVLSVGAAAQNPRAPIRTYYGNPGRERFQDSEGNGQAAAGHLVFSLDPTAGTRVIRDLRFQGETREVVLSRFLAVPSFSRRERALNLNANDVVVATEATSLFAGSGFSGANIDPTFSFFLIDPEDVAATFTAGLRLGGESYPNNIGGTSFSGN